MAITKKLTKHENCYVQVEWLDTTKQKHFAKLICIDKDCTHKKKHIQWLSQADAFYFVDELKIPQSEQPVITDWVEAF